jgi:hypothetical protein
MKHFSECISNVLPRFISKDNHKDILPKKQASFKNNSSQNKNYQLKNNVPSPCRMLPKNKNAYNRFRATIQLPTEEIRKNPLIITDKLLANEIKLLNYIIRYKQIYGEVYFSLEHLALYLGVCVSTVKNYIRNLKKLGLLLTFPQSNKTSRYKISEWFYDPRIRKILHTILAALISFQQLAFSATTKDYEKSCLRTKNNYSLYTKLNVTVCLKAYDIKLTSNRERKFVYEKSSDGIMRPILKTMKLIDWTDDHQEAVEHYSDEVLQSAYETFKRKVNSNPDNTFTFGYFLGCAKRRQEQPSLSSITNSKSKPQTGFFKKTVQDKEFNNKQESSNGNMNDSRYLEYPEYLQPVKNYSDYVNDARAPMRIWYKKHINLEGQCENCFSCLTGGMRYWLRSVDEEYRQDFLRIFPFLDQVVLSPKPLCTQEETKSILPASPFRQESFVEHKQASTSDDNSDDLDRISIVDIDPNYEAL